MTPVVQIIIVSVILAVIASVIVVHVIKYLRQPNNATCCVCDKCPYENCCKGKNIEIGCKKTDKKIADSNK